MLEEGEIIEQGTHNYLMNKRGLYRHLWDMYDYEITEASEVAGGCNMLGDIKTLLGEHSKNLENL